MTARQIEYGKKSFQIILETLKIWKDWTDADLASEIGCSPQTIINARSNPLKATARVTEPIRWLYEIEKEKRKNELI